MAAQESSYEGVVTNHGLLNRPVSLGDSAALKFRAIHSSGFGAYISIAAPLGGSGTAGYTQWGDSILVISTSASGDTIVWTGEWGLEGGEGAYAILGGAASGQGGTWWLKRTTGGALRRSAAPTYSSTRDAINASLAGMISLTGGRGEVTRTDQDQSGTGSWGATGSAFAGAQQGPAANGPQGGDKSDPKEEEGRLMLMAILALTGIWAIAYGGYRYCVPKPEPRQGSTPQRREDQEDSGADANSTSDPSGVSYGIKCPVCNTAWVSDARQLWFLHGMVLAARYGSRTVIGCGPCVRSKGRDIALTNALAGWWCVPWGLGTPFVILQNAAELSRRPDPRIVDAVLRSAGVDPEEVRLDSDGFTTEQRRLLGAAGHVLATAMWADGRAAPAEHGRALAILQQFAGSRLTTERAEALLEEGRHWEGSLSALPLEIRHSLLAMAIDIALADGPLAMVEIAMLHAVADRLGFAPGIVKTMLDDLTGKRSADEATQGSARRRRYNHEATERAAAILGVARTAGLIEIKQA
jgi:uncharacterized tellurite resistance protein B-like protein